MMRFTLIIGLLSCFCGLFAQPINDECENAIELTNLYEWCSEERAFKIYNATPSFPDDPTCHPVSDKILKDIWFTFEARDENLRMAFNSSRALGKESQLGLFTLSLYSGGCQELELDTCDFASNNGIASMNFNIIRLKNIFPGNKYYLRIATPIDSLVLDSNLFDTIGNFEFCLDSYGVDLCNSFNITTSSDTLIDFGGTANLSAETDNTLDPIDYSWFIGDSVICAQCPFVQVQPPRATTYRVIASNSDQCVTSREVEVKVRIRDIDRIVFVPNAFTPNGDRLNDLITVFGSELLQTILQFDIYDRWGNLAFRKLNFDPNDTELGWDGSRDTQFYSGDTFVYRTQVQFIDGSTKQFQGSFHLIR